MVFRLIPLFFLLAAQQLMMAQEEPHYIKFETNSVLGTVYLFEQNDTAYYYRPLNDSDVAKPYRYVQERGGTIDIYPENKAIRLSKTKAANPTFCIDSNNIYACWFSGRDIMFQRSTDGGRTFLPEEKLLISTKLGSEYTVDSIAFKNRPILLCGFGEDLYANGELTGKFRHRIYLCWTDAKYSPQDMDVFLMYSDDQGQNWTEPILVSYYPNHKAQFDADLAIDYRGFLYLHYFDKKNYPDGRSTDVTLAVSKNGGLKFDYYKINNEEPFQLAPEHVHYINYKLELDAYTYDRYHSYHYSADLNNDSIYAACDREFMAAQNFLQLPKTVPFSRKIAIPIELQDATTITAVITKPLDPYFEKRVFTEKKFPKGKSKFVLNKKELGLKKGNYTLFLYYNYTSKFAWIIDQ